jgi:hypothetical protein
LTYVTRFTLHQYFCYIFSRKATPSQTEGQMCIVCNCPKGFHLIWWLANSTNWENAHRRTILPTPRYESIWSIGNILQIIHSLPTGLLGVASFTPRPLYLKGKPPGYPLNRGPSGPHITAGYFREEKIFCPSRYSNKNMSVIQSVGYLLHPGCLGSLLYMKQ